jgi:hypothetical protein
MVHKVYVATILVALLALMLPLVKLYLALRCLVWFRLLLLSGAT